MSKSGPAGGGGGGGGGPADDAESRKSRKSKVAAPNAMEGARGSSVQIDPDMVVKEWKPPEQEEVDPSDMLLKEDFQPKETYGLKGSPSSQLRIEQQRRDTEAKSRQRMSMRMSKQKAKEEEKAAKEGRASKAKASAEKKNTIYSQQDARPSETPSFTPSAGITSPTQRPSIQSERPSTQVPRLSGAAVGNRPSRLLMGSIMAGRRGSVGDDRAKGPKYAPTYRLESKNPFKSWQVRKVLEELMQNSCRMKRYDPAAASKKAISLAGDIRAAVRTLNYDRYKICVKVDIGQKWDQGASCVARFMWDVEKDDFAFYVCENSIVYIVASVFGLYYD